MKIRIRQSLLANIKDEVEPLLQSQWEEVAHFQEDIPLSIVWERYLEMEKKDMYFVLTARDGDELVGYSSFYFLPNPDHYGESALAAVDVIYLRPAYRKTGLGAILIEQTEQLAKRKGAKWISFHIKPEPDLNFSPYLLKRGYLLHEISCAKVL